MNVKYRFIAFFAIFTMAFFICDKLYSQEAGDTTETQDVAGTDNFEPSDDELASLLTTTPNPNAVVGPLIQTKWAQSAPFNDLFPIVPGGQRTSSSGRILTDCTILLLRR